MTRSAPFVTSLHYAAMSNPSIPADLPRRCQRCGRGLAPHEQSCEGCALATATRRGGRVTRRAVAIAMIAAAVEMGAVWWFAMHR